MGAADHALIVEAYLRSGQSLRAFAATIPVNPGTLHRWVSAYRGPAATTTAEEREQTVDAVRVAALSSDDARRVLTAATKAILKEVEIDALAHDFALRAIKRAGELLESADDPRDLRALMATANEAHAVLRRSAHLAEVPESQGPGVVDLVVRRRLPEPPVAEPAPEATGESAA